MQLPKVRNDAIKKKCRRYKFRCAPSEIAPSCPHQQNWDNISLCYGCHLIKSIEDTVNIISQGPSKNEANATREGTYLCTFKRFSSIYFNLIV